MVRRFQILPSLDEVSQLQGLHPLFGLLAYLSGHTRFIAEREIHRRWIARQLEIPGDVMSEIRDVNFVVDGHVSGSANLDQVRPRCEITEDGLATFGRLEQHSARALVGDSHQRLLL